MTTSDISRHPAPATVSPYYKNGSLKKYVTSNNLTLRGKMDLVKSPKQYHYKRRHSRLYRSCTKLPVVWLSCMAVRVGLSTEISSQYVRPRPLIVTSYRGLKSLQGNILISDDGQAVLTDFGLSIVLEMSGFTTKNTPGTLRYMAAELLAEPTTSEAIRPTIATDAWAFGITATEVRSPRGTTLCHHLRNIPSLDLLGETTVSRSSERCCGVDICHKKTWEAQAR